MVTTQTRPALARRIWTALNRLEIMDWTVVGWGRLRSRVVEATANIMFQAVNIKLSISTSGMT